MDREREREREREEWLLNIETGQQGHIQCT